MNPTDLLESTKTASSIRSEGKKPRTKRHRKILIAWAAIGLIVIAVPALHSFLTHYIESESFREMVSRETSKGLKIQGQYKPFRHSGFLSTSSSQFQGAEGAHSMKRLEASNVEGTFNPWGVFLKRWQVDDIRVESGMVELQKTEGGEKQKEEKPKPWYSIFLPNRIYLKQTRVKSGNVIWTFRGKRAGIHDLQLLIHPNGRDFEYWGQDGDFQMSGVPELRVQNIHLLIRKPRLDLYGATLIPPGEKSPAFIQIQGAAGLQEDRTVTSTVSIHKMPMQPWVPERWRSCLEGNATGEIDWHSNGTKMKGSSAAGHMEISDARLHGLPALEKLALFTENKEFLDIHFNRFSMDLDWKHPRLEAKRILIESKGLLRIEGSLEVEDKQLKGDLELGVTQESLKKFPHADEKIFNRQAEGYLWTTVHLSGTLEKPEQDLSPRLVKLLWESPSAFFDLLFREIGDWFKNIFE